MTRLLKPIDVSINKPLKDYLRKNILIIAAKKTLLLIKYIKK